jgi:hypothetical protein
VGRYAHLGLRAHLNLKGDITVADTIATQDLVVHDDALGIDRHLFAGQPVPPDLLDAYRKATGDESAGQLSDEEVAGQQRAADLGLGTTTGVAPDVPDPDAAGKRARKS